MGNILVKPCLEPHVDSNPDPAKAWRSENGSSGLNNPFWAARNKTMYVIYFGFFVKTSKSDPTQCGVLKQIFARAFSA